MTLSKCERTKEYSQVILSLKYLSYIIILSNIQTGILMKGLKIKTNTGKHIIALKRDIIGLPEN